MDVNQLENEMLLGKIKDMELTAISKPSSGFQARTGKEIPQKVCARNLNPNPTRALPWSPFGCCSACTHDHQESTMMRTADDDASTLNRRWL